MKIKLMDVIEALEMASNEIQAFYNTKTNEIVYLMEFAEDYEELAEEIDFNEAYISLPSSYDIHEYHMMEMFIWDLEDESKANQLAFAIRGRGAFRRFKDKLYDLNLEENWYKYRDNEYKKIAIEWCEENNIEYEE